MRQYDLALADVKNIHRRNIESQKCQISKDIFLCYISAPTLSKKKEYSLFIYMWRIFTPGRSYISRCHWYTLKKYWNQTCKISKDIFLCNITTPTLSQKKEYSLFIYMWRMFAPGRSCISRCQGYSSKEGSAFLMWALANQCYFGVKPWWISFYLSVKKSILLAILFMTLVWLPMSWCEAVQGLHCKPMSFQCKTLLNIITMFLLQLNSIDSMQFNQSIPTSVPPKFSLSKPNLYSVSFTCDIWKWVKQ